MAMRVGEMMVIIRAQDFASRTLRRVGGEFAHLSQEQQIAGRRAQLSFQKMSAAGRVAAAESNRRRLSYIKNLRDTADEYHRLTNTIKEYEKLERTVRRGGKFLPGVPRETVRSWQNAADAIKRVTGARTAGQGVGVMEDRRAAIRQKLGPGLDRGMERISKWPAALKSAAANASVFGSAWHAANAEVKAAHAALDANARAQLAFNQALARMPINRLQDLGHALGGIGRTMQLFGAVGVGAFGLAANQAADFNTQISLAATQARDLAAPASQVQKRIDQLTNGFQENGEEMKGVLDLMREFPADQTAMAESAYDIFSSMDLMHNGITDVAAGLDLLKKANQVAVAGGEDLAIATDAMITVFNNFDPTLQNTTETLDTMFDIIRFGRMRLGDFNTMMNKVAPAAAGAGLKLRDVGGAMAFLTEVMPSQRMVATGISRLIEALNHPDIVKGLKILHVNVRKATGELRPLDDIMKDLAKTFPQLTTGQQTAAEFFKMISSLGRGGGQGVMFTAEGRKSMTQILTHMDQYLARQKQIDDNTGEFAKTQEAQMRSLGIQWQIFLNRVRALVIAIGTDAIPVFTELGQILDKMLKFWEGLSDKTQQSIVRLGVFAAVGTLVAGVLLAMLGAFMGIEAGFRRLLLSGKGAVGMLSNFMMVARRLAAVGAIAIILETAMTGEADSMALIQGMIAGGILGSALGPGGAVAGGLIIPIVQKIMSRGGEGRNNISVPDWIANSNDPIVVAYRDYLQSAFDRAFDEGVQPMSLDKWRHQIWDNIIPGASDAIEANRSWIASERQKGKMLGKSGEDMARYIEAMKKYIKSWETFGDKMKTYREELKSWKEDMKQWAESMAQATTDARRTAVDNLQNMYMDILQVNKDAMGELFQGPLFSGESFQIAKEWGVTAGIKEMIKDLKQQTAEFVKWQRGLATLAKKGLPTEFIKEIQQMGPQEGMGFVQGIIKGTPKQIQTLVAAWKDRNKKVQSQTKMDFVDEITRFRNAGLDMGKAIVEGFEKAAVGKWFDSWIQTKFPAVINGAVNSAMADWRASNPQPTAPVKPKPPGPPPTPPRQVQRTAAGDTRRAQSTGTTNNQTINVYFADSAGTARDKKREEERRIAFIMRTMGRIPH